ncbi:MAG: peptidylprolyl isomerase [Chloroflexi bacterium]|nr:peptidylprolyl isomerase [Chloroflexota bacterium]
MSKKDTTARARKVREQELKARRSRAEQEHYTQRIVLIVAGLGFVVAVLILAYALLNDYVVVPEQSITTVDGTGIKTKDFQERVRTERWFKANEIQNYALVVGVDQAVQQYSNDILALREPSLFGGQVLDDMELQVLLEKEAKKRGIEIDRAAIDSAVDQYIASYLITQLTPTPSPSATDPTTPTSTPLITSTASNTPTITNTPTETIQPTAEGCTADQTDCATVTPLPTNTPTETPSPTLEQTYTPTPSDTPVAPDDIRSTVTKLENSFYGDAKDVAKIDRDAVRDIFTLRALRAALLEDVTKDESTQEVWVNARHILIQVPEDPSRVFTQDTCNSEEWAPYKQQAEQVLAALNAGEPFAALAQAVSDDGSGANGGGLGWSASGGYVPEFKAAVDTADIGAIVGPVCSQFGFHVIQVMERELRDISASQLQQNKSTAYQTWETDLVSNADIQRRDNWEDRTPSDPSYSDLLGNVFG